ncbi:TRADD-N-associated membrane domain-containing protein [Amycolatopsis lexingtonensis]|uniref:TRADD-N-associated membrane domain-containing protein n=1 Tax=Amycolatopsis lexingtonensis TaxID=218822 RepID=UPI003F6EA004
MARSKIAFWFSLALGAIGFATILAGAVMAYFADLDNNLKESDNLQRALGVLELLDDVEMRTRLIAIAGAKQLFPAENAASLSDAIELKN